MDTSLTTMSRTKKKGSSGAWAESSITTTGISSKISASSWESSATEPAKWWVWSSWQISSRASKDRPEDSCLHLSPWSTLRTTTRSEFPWKSTLTCMLLYIKGQKLRSKLSTRISSQRISCISAKRNKRLMRISWEKETWRVISSISVSSCSLPTLSKLMSS